MNKMNWKVMLKIIIVNISQNLFKMSQDLANLLNKKLFIMLILQEFLKKSQPACILMSLVY